MKKIDATGLTCPIPVVMAKKALREAEVDGVVITVDNKTSSENLEKLAKSLKCGFEVAQPSEGLYDVTITKAEGFGNDAALNAGDTIAVISSDKMGEGDPELGKSLMKAFIYALTEADEIPAKIVLYNSGVTLAVDGSPALEDLKALEKKGAEIYACGACLNHYGLTEKLAAGEVTNMYAIVGMMNEASKIIKP